MKKIFVTVALILSSFCVHAADTYTGSLIGAPTYNRIFTGDVNPDCLATSTFSGIGVGIEYIAIPIYTPLGENLVASFNPATTNVGDTVLSLYCDPFDPNAADLNLVAYNDDGGPGLLSSFDGSEGVLFKPGQQYWLVVSIFSPSGIGGGDFELNVGGQFRFGMVTDEVIPTTSSSGLTILAVLVGILGFWTIRRRRHLV